MGKEGLVSVITPAYNASRYIGETIGSVLQQTCPNWEMIVADDGSTDNTLEIVRSFEAKEPRIRAIRLPQSGGPAHGPARARNAALAAAKGQYIAFLDSDDLWVPEKLSVQVDFLKTNEEAFCFSAYRRISADGLRTGRRIPVPDRVSYSSLLHHNVIATLTVMIDRNRTGDFRMTDAGYDDFILWLEILKRGFVARGLPQELSRYRVAGSGSVSSRRFRAAQWVWNIYRNVERLPAAQSAWYLGNHLTRSTLKHAFF